MKLSIRRVAALSARHGTVSAVSLQYMLRMLQQSTAAGPALPNVYHQYNNNNSGSLSLSGKRLAVTKLFQLFQNPVIGCVRYKSTIDYRDREMKGLIRWTHASRLLCFQSSFSISLSAVVYQLENSHSLAPILSLTIGKSFSNRVGISIVRWFSLGNRQSHVETGSKNLPNDDSIEGSNNQLRIYTEYHFIDLFPYPSLTNPEEVQPVPVGHSHKSSAYKDIEFRQKRIRE